MDEPVTKIAKAILALTYGDLIEMARSLAETTNLTDDVANLAGKLHSWAENRAEEA